MAKIKVFEKRSKVVVKKAIRFLSVFFHNHLCNLQYLRTYFLKAGYQ